MVILKYVEAKSNLENLKKLGASLLHEVDATKMNFHTDLKMRKFDRIIYNFPHAGFFGKEDNADMIEMHRGLVDGFFRNARGMLQAGGEIHVNHKTTAPFCQWNIEELASQNSLILAECVDFKIEDYPGYKNKRGHGSRCDEPFPLGECSTFKFRLSCKTKRSLRDTRHFAPAIHERSQQYLETSFQMQHRSTSNDFNYPRAGHLTNMGQVSEDVHLLFMQHLAPAAPGRSLQFQETPFQMQQFSPSINFSHPRAGYSLNVERVLNDVQLLSTIAARNERFGMIDGHLNNPTEIFGRNMIDSSYIHAPRFHFRETAEMLGRTLNGDTYVLRELQRRNAILRQMQRARLMSNQG